MRNTQNTHAWRRTRDDVNSTFWMFAKWKIVVELRVSNEAERFKRKFCFRRTNVAALLKKNFLTHPQLSLRTMILCALPISAEVIYAQSHITLTLC